MSQDHYRVLVCRGPTCGQQHDSASLRRALDVMLERANLQDVVELDWQSCFGRCSQGPNMLVRRVASTEPQEPAYSVAIMPKKKGRAALYSRVTVESLVEIVREHLVGGQVVRRLLSVKPKSATKPSADKPREHKLPQVLSTVRGRSEGK